MVAVRRMTRPALVLAAGLLAAACTASSAQEPADDPALAPPTAVTAPATTAPAVTTSRASTTTAPTTTAPTTTGALPQPAPVPADPRAAEPEVVLGTIEIPRIGLAVPLYQGVTLTTLDKGPGHWPGTAMPGGIGNVVVAGHRVTHTHPFRHIDRLEPGDEVVFTIGDERFSYAVTGSEVVGPDALWIVDQTPAATATLFACHPPGSARYRYVVHLELVTT